LHGWSFLRSMEYHPDFRRREPTIMFRGTHYERELSQPNWRRIHGRVERLVTTTQRSAEIGPCLHQRGDLVVGVGAGPRAHQLYAEITRAAVERGTARDRVIADIATAEHVVGARGVTGNPTPSGRGPSSPPWRSQVGVSWTPPNRAAPTRRLGLRAPAPIRSSPPATRAGRRALARRDTVSLVPAWTDGVAL